MTALTPAQQFAIMHQTTLLEQHARAARIALATMMDTAAAAQTPTILTAGAEVNGRVPVQDPAAQAKQEFAAAAQMFGRSMHSLQVAYQRLDGAMRAGQGGQEG